MPSVRLAHVCAAACRLLSRGVWQLPSATERLAAEAELALERRAQREMQRRERDTADCTFKPQVNDLSRLVAGEHDGKSVFERLAARAEELEHKRQ
eukprot:2894428-Prymnesium_polylepis.1